MMNVRWLAEKVSGTANFASHSTNCEARLAARLQQAKPSQEPSHRTLTHYGTRFHILRLLFMFRDKLSAAGLAAMTLF